MCKVLRMTFFANASYSDTVVSPCPRSRRSDKYMPSPSSEGLTATFQKPWSAGTHPGDVRRRDDLILETVDLEGGMGDAKPLTQNPLDRIHDLGRLLDRLAPGDREVSGQDHEIGGDRPDVKVMDAADARDRQDGLRDLARLEFRRRAFQDDADGFSEESRRAEGDERDDQDGDGRVEENHTSESDDDGPHDDARRSEGVPVSVEERPSDVDVPSGGTAEEGDHRQVRRETCEADDEHGPSLYRLGLRNPTVDGKGKGRGDPREENGVYERREDLDSVVSERHLRRVGPFADAQSRKAQSEGGGIGPDVTRIRQEGEGTAPPAAQRLEEGRPNRDPEGDREAPFQGEPRLRCDHRRPVRTGACGLEPWPATSLLEDVELVPVGVLEHRVGGPVFLRGRGRELDACPSEGGLLFLHVFRGKGDPRVSRLELVEPRAEVEGDVLLLGGDRDPMALVLADLEAEHVLVPLRGLQGVRHDDGDGCEAEHGRRDSVPLHKHDGKPATRRTGDTLRFRGMPAEAFRRRGPFSSSRQGLASFRVSRRSNWEGIPRGTFSASSCMRSPRRPSLRFPWRSCSRFIRRLTWRPRPSSSARGRRWGPSLYSTSATRLIHTSRGGWAGIRSALRS